MGQDLLGDTGHSKNVAFSKNMGLWGGTTRGLEKRKRTLFGAVVPGLNLQLLFTLELKLRPRVNSFFVVDKSVLNVLEILKHMVYMALGFTSQLPKASTPGRVLRNAIKQKIE